MKLRQETARRPPDAGPAAGFPLTGTEARDELLELGIRKYAANDGIRRASGNTTGQAAFHLGGGHYVYAEQYLFEDKWRIRHHYIGLPAQPGPGTRDTRREK